MNQYATYTPISIDVNRGREIDFLYNEHLLVLLQFFFISTGIVQTMAKSGVKTEVCNSQPNNYEALYPKSLSLLSFSTGR